MERVEVDDVDASTGFPFSGSILSKLITAGICGKIWENKIFSQIYHNQRRKNGFSRA